MAFDLLLKAGSTSQIIEVTIRDSTTGQGKTGIAAASVAFLYQKRGAAASTATSACSVMSAGTWVSGGWCAVDAANAPGLYQFGIPNAALSGTDAVTIRFKIAGCIDKEVKIVLTAVDLQDAAAAGISRLDAAVSGVAASVWTNGTRSLNATVDANVVSWAGTAVSVLSDGTSNYPKVGVRVLDTTYATNQIASTVWGYPLSNITNANTIGLTLKTNVDAAVSGVAASVWTQGTRQLTSTQNFNNTGQTALVPANVKNWNDAAVMTMVSTDDSQTYPAIAVKYITDTQIDKVWDEATANHNYAGTFGLLVNTNLDAKVSGAATPSQAASAVWGLQTDSVNLFTTFGGFLKQQLDATVSSRLAAGSSVSANVTQWNGNPVTQYVNSGTAYPSINVFAWLGFQCTGIVNGAPTVSLATASADSVVDKVWDELTSGHTTAGSYGKLLSDNIDARISSISGGGSSLTAADVWAYATAGLTTAGSIGKLVVDNLNAPITSRSNLSGTDIQSNVWGAQVGSFNSTVGSFGKLMYDNVNAPIGNMPASVWTQTTRTLTATQSFDNTGQTTNLPVNLKAWNGYTVNQVNLGGGAAAPTVNVGYWATYTVQADATGFPLMYVHGSDGQGDQALRNAVWQAATDAYGTTAGSFGKLLADDIDAKISSRMMSGATVNANVIQWNGSAHQLTSVDDLSYSYPKVHIEGASSTGKTAIIDAVWNAPIASWNGAVGSFGQWVDRMNGMIEPDGGVYRYTANALENAPSGGGSSLTAADVWAYATRTLTDKTGFTLSAAQSFNNTGQTTVLPTDVTKWAGTSVSLAGVYPAVGVAYANGNGQQSIASAVWDIDMASHQIGGTTGLRLSNLDATVSSRLASASYVAPDNAGVGSIKAQTDKLFFTDHGDGTYDVRSGSTGTVVVDNAAIATAVWSAGTRSLTDKAGFSLANGSISTATFTAGAIDATVAPNVDAAVSSRMATFAYVAPDNAGIAAIQAQTDQIVFAAHGDGTFDVRANAVNTVPVDNVAIATAVWSAGTRTLSAAVDINSNGDINAIRAKTDAYVAPDNAGIAAIKAQTDQLVFISGDLRATLDGEVVNAGVDTAGIATAVWLAGTRSLTDKAGFSLANASISTSTFAAGAIDAAVAPNLDAQVSSRMASFTYIPPDNAGIAAIKAQTDQLLFFGGDVVATLNGEVVSAGLSNASIAAAVWAGATRTINGGTLDSVTNVVNPVMTTQAAAIASIKAQTDKITFVTHGDGTWDVRVPIVAGLTAADVWSYGPRTLTDKSGFALANGSVTSATFGPGAINSDVAPNLDVTVSSRMASFVYVPPDNASIAAIKALAEKLHFLPHGDGTYDVQSNAVAVVDAGVIANAVWANGVRSLTTQVTDWTDLERGQIRKALGLSGSTAETSGEGLLDDVHHVSMKLQFNSESDVIASLAGETVFLNPMQNFNNIGQVDELPAKDAILRQLLTPERADRLDHLDVPVSSRSSHSPTDVWSFSERTLTSFGTLVADMAAAVWSYGTRTLTSFGSLVADIWGAAIRTITGGIVDLSAQAKADVRSAADAALSDFDPLTYSDAAFDRDQIIDQVEAVLAAVNVKPDASAIASAVDILLSTNHGEGSWIDTTKGSGPITYTVTVTDGTNPVAFASVRLSVGPLGISQVTDSRGKAVFDVQPGTYRVQIAKLGYSGHSTTVEIHSEPAEQSFPAVIALLAAISLPPEPGQCTAYLTTYDAVGHVQSGVEIEVRLVSPPAGSIAESFSAKPWTVTSDAQGLVQVTLLKNAAYQARRGSGEWHLLKTDQRDSIPMPTVLSHPSK